MVLKHSLFGLTTLALIGLLSACSTLNTQQSQRPKLVPVKGSTPETLPPKPLQTSITPSQANIEDSATSSLTIPALELKPDKLKSEYITVPESNILETLLGKAKKAMEAQQWLRAQRVLEQALRVDAYKPETFTLYGDVYAKMGAKDKARNMYQRAIYLAKESQSMTKAISQKLQTLED